MLNHISWASYWKALAIILFCYYVYIFWINRTRLLQYKPVVTPDLPSLDDLLHPQAVACNSELTAYLEQVALTKPSKKEILFGIHKVIKHYPMLQETVYQPAISKWITFEARDKCAIHLSNEDIRQVWLV